MKPSHRKGLFVRFAVGCALAGMMAGAAASPAAAGQKNKGDVWVDNVGQPPGPGHEQDPHLACADINLWGNALADGSGTYTIDGWPPSGSMEQVYSSSWNYDTTAGGDQVTSVISVKQLIANAIAGGDAPVNKQGFHFKLQFVQDPQKHKTFWVNCGPQASTYVGYADTLRGDGTPSTPTPWQGAQNVTFVGCGYFGTDVCRQQGGHDAYDAGAVRIDNTGSVPFTVTNASVTIGNCAYSPWGGLNVSVPAGGTLILTETGGTPPTGCSPAKNSENNFDTSESATKGVCTNNGVIPVISYAINGQATQVSDTNQILNTGGLDKHECLGGNEGHDWSPIS